MKICRQPAGRIPNRGINSVILGFLLCLPALESQAEKELSNLSLNQLLNIDVTSASKRDQRLFEVPSSIYVITAEDIRRSGANRIQDVLQMAPGTWFSDFNYHNSATAIRDISDGYPQSILWLMDGIPITHPIVAGMPYYAIDIPLADVERIEVIKGPGGTIYGTNATTGVISIFTRRAEDSEGHAIVWEGGSQGYRSSFARLGSRLEGPAYLSAWLLTRYHEGYDKNPAFDGPLVRPPRLQGANLGIANPFPEKDDKRSMASAGLKFDILTSENLTWSTNVFFSRADLDEYVRLVKPASGNAAGSRDSTWLLKGYVQNLYTSLRADYSRSPNHNLFVQAFYRDNPSTIAIGGGNDVKLRIYDFEAQNNILLARRHWLSTGVNLRAVDFEVLPTGDRSNIILAYPVRREYLWGGFIQDEISLMKGLKLTLGSKMESWTLIGTEPMFSPSVRLGYSPDSKSLFWAALSRGFSTPASTQVDMEYQQEQVPGRQIFESRGLEAPKAAGHWVSVVPGEDMRPTSYVTAETGFRTSPWPWLEMDISLFNTYVWGLFGATKQGISLDRIVPSAITPGDTISPIYYENNANAVYYGGEAVARVRPLDFLQFEASYSLFLAEKKLTYESSNETAGTIGNKFTVTGSTPEHIGRLRLYLDLPGETKLTANAMFSSEFLRGTPYNYYTLKSDPINGILADKPSPQLRLDLRLEKRFYHDRASVNVWGRNLTAKHFVENYLEYVPGVYPHIVHPTYGGGVSYEF